MTVHICRGVLNTKKRFLKCGKCKCKRLHDWHERYDSVLTVCRTSKREEVYC